MCYHFDMRGHLGQHIREARRAAGLTQAELAPRLGLSRPRLCDIECERRRLPRMLRELVARWLAGGPMPTAAESEQARALGAADGRLARRCAGGQAVPAMVCGCDLGPQFERPTRRRRFTFWTGRRACYQ